MKNFQFLISNFQSRLQKKFSLRSNNKQSPTTYPLCSMPYALRASRGFTLIELLIVFFVIAVISTVSFAGFFQFSRHETLLTATADARNMLQAARSYSQTQVINPAHCVTGGNCQCAQGEQFNGYQVLFCCPVSNSSNPLCPKFSPNDCIAGDMNEHYELNIICGSNKHTVDSKDLPTQVSVDNTHSTTRSFLFLPLTGAVSSGTVTFSGFSQSTSISITGPGVIQ